MAYGSPSLSYLNWISSSINSNLDNGNFVEFWNFKWLGSNPLYAQISIAFATVMNPKITVVDMVFWNDTSWKWNLELVVVGLSKEALSQFVVLLEILKLIKLDTRVEDAFVLVERMARLLGQKQLQGLDRFMF